MVATTNIGGSVAPGWEKVRDAFVGNFAGEEVGDRKSTRLNSSH